MSAAIDAPQSTRPQCESAFSRCESEQGKGARTSGLLPGLLRRAALSRLQRVRSGRIVLLDRCGESLLGADCDDLPPVRVEVHDGRFYRRLATGGSLGAAESYLEGEWDCDDLPGLFRILCRDLAELEGMDRGAAAISVPLTRLAHWCARNTRRGSRKNIEAHYDLGDEFFSLFLDPTMMYSSAIFERPGMTLEEAQIARLDRICRQLDLRPWDHLLEIGTGWGGLALHAARNYGCRVTTTTISKNQHRRAAERIAAAGLEQQITLLDRDYRDLEGSYDKLVSIEMIEAVGHQYLDTFFGTCARLLRPGGSMLIQAIVMPDQRYAAYLKSVDFIQRYIFPGGCLPSIGAMQQSVARTSNLRLIGLHDFAADYAQTLREWRRRFLANLGQARGLGLTERFLRMWDYYLCYCEAAFDERAVGVVHARWGK